MPHNKVSMYFQDDTVRKVKVLLPEGLIEAVQETPEYRRARFTFAATMTILLTEALTARGHLDLPEGVMEDMPGQMSRLRVETSRKNRPTPRLIGREGPRRTDVLENPSI